MTTKHFKIIAATVVSLTAILVMVGNGCSKRADYSSMSSSNDALNNQFDNDGQGGTNPQSADIIAGAKTASVVYAKQALDQLTSCAGVRVASDDTIRMYNSKEGSISAYGDFNSVTAPMLVALTNISGEVCDDLIDQEIRDEANTNDNGRVARIFVGFNMSSTTLPSQSATNDAIARLSQSCWHKQESAQERTQILDLLATVPNGSAMATRRQALLLCTAMLSSLNSLMN
jgi:hypothetical protein